MNDWKPILCLDFDGVIHSYASGWKGADVVPDPPVPGAIAFIRNALDHFEVHIFSSRSHQPGGQEAMRDWLARWAIDEGAGGPKDHIWILEIKWPVEKPPALVTIDDRAICFDGTWPAFADIKAFKPWNKK